LYGNTHALAKYRFVHLQRASELRRELLSEDFNTTDYFQLPA
jgi:hypothetical protein